MAFFSGHVGDSLRWISSWMPCCAAQEAPAGQQAVEDNNQTPRVCSKQPCALPPPAAGSDLDTPSHRRRAHSVSIAGRSRSRSFTSSSSFAETIYTRKRSKTNDSRLQIGAPSHFRRVENNEHFSTPRRPAFRPLELSIYMPDNRLMPLPQFTANEPPALELEQQTLALAQILTRSNSVSSSSFSIPRKPLASSVLDLLLHDSSAGRASLDTHTSPSVTGDDWEAQPLRARPSLTHSLSSQDLLASMKSQSQVQLPKPVAMARARSNTEPPALWRSARPSEQYRRVEKALEARQVLDAKIRELDILLEHRVSAVLLSGHQSTRRKEGLGFSDASSHNQLATIAEGPSPAFPKLPPQSHPPTRSATFSDSKSARAQHPEAPRRAPPPPPPSTALPSSQPPINQSLTMARLSKWLFPSPPPLPPNAGAPRAAFYQCTDVAPQTTSTSTASSTTSANSSTTSLTSIATSVPSTHSRPISRHRTFGHAAAAPSHRCSAVAEESWISPHATHFGSRESVGVLVGVAF